MSGIGANPVENNGLALSLPYIIKSPSAAVISPNQYIVKTNYHQLYPPSGSVIISSKQMAATSTAAHLLQQQFQAQVQAAANIANGITTGVPNTNGVPSTAPVAAPGNYYGPSSMYFNPNVMPPTATKQTWVPNTPKFVKKITPENRPNNLAQRQNNRLNDSFENSRPRHNSSPPRDKYEGGGGGRSSRYSPPRHRKYSDSRGSYKDREYPGRRDRSRRDYRLSPVRTHHPPYSRARDQYRESRDYDKATPPPVANLFNALQQPTLHYHGDSNPKTVELARRKYSPTRRYQNQGSSSRGRGYESERTRRRYDDYYYSSRNSNRRRRGDSSDSSSSNSNYNYRADRSNPPRSPSKYSGYSSRASGRSSSMAPTQSILRKGGDSDADRRRRATSIANFRRSRSPEKKRVRWNPDLENSENARPTRQSSPASRSPSPSPPPPVQPPQTRKTFFTPISSQGPSVPSVLLANFNHDLMQKTQLNGTHTHTLLNAGDLDNKVDISDEEDTTLAAVAINPADMVDYEGETLTSQPVNWRVLNLFSGRVDSKLLQNYISFAGARPQSAVGRTFPLPSKHPTPQQLNDPDFYVPGAISSDEEEEEISEREVDDEEDEEESQEVKSQESEKSQDNQPKKQPETQYPVHFLLRNNNLSV